LRFSSIPEYLPYTQFSLSDEGLQTRYILLNPPDFTMVYQLLGLKAKTKVEKLLVSLIQLLRQITGAQVSEFL